MFAGLSLFQKYYKTIAINLSQQQAVDVDPKGIEQISFAGNLNQQVAMFFILEKTRKCFRFFTRNSESIKNWFYFNIIPI